MSRRVDPRDDAGLSMTELLVAMLVTAVILAIAATFFVQMTRTTASASRTQTATRTASVAANETTSVLRMATNTTTSAGAQNAFISASRDSVTLYSNSVGGSSLTSQFTFTLNNGVLQETVCPGSDVGATVKIGTCQPVITLASGLSSTDANPLFSYYVENAAGTSGTWKTAPSNADLASIAQVAVTIVSTSPGTSPQTVTLANTVVLRNLEVPS